MLCDGLEQFAGHEGGKALDLAAGQPQANQAGGHDACVVDDDERAFIREQMAAPVDAAALAAEVPDGAGPQVYLMSLMAIEFDNRKEAEYLHALAQGLGLDKQTVNGIHEKVGVINLYA